MFSLLFFIFVLFVVICHLLCFEEEDYTENKSTDSLPTLQRSLTI
jgi:hypothetical protein